MRGAPMSIAGPRLDGRRDVGEWHTGDPALGGEAHESSRGSDQSFHGCDEGWVGADGSGVRHVEKGCSERGRAEGEFAKFSYRGGVVGRQSSFGEVVEPPRVVLDGDGLDELPVSGFGPIPHRGRPVNAVRANADRLREGVGDLIVGAQDA